MIKNKKYVLFSMLLVIVIILMSFLVNADLLISPQQLNITSVIGEEKLIPLNFTNTYNFSVSNISVYEEPHFTLEDSGVLYPNQSKVINLKILATQKENKTGILKFYFYYITTETTIPITYNANISDSAYIPDELTLHRFDKIIYFNKGTTIHTITDIDGEFDEEIMPNESVSIPFITIKTYTIYDKWYGFQQTVHCLNNTLEIPTHESNFDKSIPFTLKSIHPQTTLELNLLVNEMEVKYDESHEGVFQIKNIGNKTAKSVKFSCEPNWCVYFSKNNYDLESGNLNYVTFIISPLISSSSETNKTHIIKIIGRSDNTQEVYDNLSVYIPFTSQVFETNVTDLETLKYLHEVFCPAHPTSILCQQSPIIVYKNRTIYEIPPIVVDFSAEEVVEWRTRLAQLETNRRLDREDIIQIKNDQQVLLSYLNSINQTMTDIKKDQSSFENLIIGFLLILLIGIIGGITFLLIKKGKKEKAYRRVEEL